MSNPWIHFGLVQDLEFLSFGIVCSFLVCWIFSADWQCWSPCVHIHGLSGFKCIHNVIAICIGLLDVIDQELGDCIIIACLLGQSDIISVVLESLLTFSLLARSVLTWMTSCSSSWGIWASSTSSSSCDHLLAWLLCSLWSKNFLN